MALSNCSNYQTVRKERPVRTHWIQQIWGGKASGGRTWGGDTAEVGKKKHINRELDGSEGTESRSPALEALEVPSRGLVSAPKSASGM